MGLPSALLGAGQAGLSGSSPGGSSPHRIRVDPGQRLREEHASQESGKTLNWELGPPLPTQWL